MHEALGAAAIVAACRQFLAVDAEAIGELSRTPASACYRVRVDDGSSVIVKLYRGAAGRKAAQEHSIIDALAHNATIRTATVLAGGQLDGHDASVLITADLGDHTLWRAVEEGACVRLEALELIGELLATFHQIDLAVSQVRGDEQWLPEAMIEVRIHQQLALLRGDPTDSLARRVEPALQQLAGLCREARGEVACHGDLHPANVVLCRTEEGVVAPHLVDFEAAVRCVPEYDVAKSIVTSSALADNERRTLLTGYGERRGISDELLCAFVVFHVVDGWVYAAQLEGRDRSLWRSRVDEMLAHYLPLF